MRSVASRVAGLPPAAVGAASAAVAEMAIGLLLYVRGGFIGALTLILCAQTAAGSSAAKRAMTFSISMDLSPRFG